MSEAVEVKEVIDWFIRHRVRSISPQTSIFLMEIANEIEAEIKKDATTPRTIRTYLFALKVVADAGHVQQGVVIAQLSRALDKAKSI